MPYGAPRRSRRSLGPLSVRSFLTVHSVRSGEAGAVG